MALSQIVWSLDDKRPLPTAELDDEKELEALLEEHIELLNPDWLVIGRQVPTPAGKHIDLLCMDRDGDLIAIELKRDQTPREVTAQTLDYASSVDAFTPAVVADLYLDYARTYLHREENLDAAFRRKYGIPLDEGTLNQQNVKMIIVATVMDGSTERIITYLRDTYMVDINILFFRVFKYEVKRLISRAWFAEDVEEAPAPGRSLRNWNGEYYVSFGIGPRQWEDAVQYGFISGGGGSWYSQTLKMLEPGDRVWVNLPHTGYVGVGIVEEPSAPASETHFLVDGQAVRETGFFGNQNTVCRPQTDKWNFTVKRLKEIWHIED